MRWQVIVPVKSTSNGKTRLHDPQHDAERHARLVRAIQRDTIDAILAAVHADTDANAIDGVHVVGSIPDLPLEVGVMDDPGGGLNAALRHGAEVLRQASPDCALAIVVADLPALRPEDLLAVLGSARNHPRAFVPDWHGTGTSLLTALPGNDANPLFGPDSAARHLASGAVKLDAPDSVRSDVDTPADLQRCLELGVGPETWAVVRTDADRPRESLT